MPDRIRMMKPIATEGEGNGYVGLLQVNNEAHGNGSARAEWRGGAVRHQPPLDSHWSNMGSRSQPQNGSPSAMKNGEPNTFLANAWSDRALARSLMGGSVMPNSSCLLSMPNGWASAATTSASRRSRPSPK